MNEKISAIGVVPVIKLNHPERDAAKLGKALSAGGVPVAEITFRAAGADTAIKLMKEACPDMLVGAGTVTTTAQIDKVIAAGGDFIVSPAAPRRASISRPSSSGWSSSSSSRPSSPAASPRSRPWRPRSPSSRSCPPAASA